MAGVAKKLEGANALLFENVIPSIAPIFTGLYWNREVLARLFQTKPEQLPFLKAEAIEQWQQNPVSPVTHVSGPANEINYTDDIDLMFL